MRKCKKRKGIERLHSAPKSAEVVESKGDKGSGVGKGRDGLAAANQKIYYHRMTRKSSKK
jgi:hypothetical protein